MDNELFHVGVGHEDDPPGRGSGRFAWGSGDNPHQHQFDFLSEVKRLKKNGLKEADIAKMLLGQKRVDKNGEPVWYDSNDLRAEIAIQNSNQWLDSRARALELLDQCHGNVSEVARRMGKNESSVRNLLNPILNERKLKYKNTADLIKNKIDNNGWPLDISKATELYMGVTDSTKKVAIAMLEKEGYVKAWVPVPQMGTGHETNVMVLAPPGTPYSEIYKKRFELKTIQEFSPDLGKTWWTPEFPESLNSKRIMIRYAEDGGKDKDGVIELRRGVEDISLGNSQYAQVRIAVDGTNYMKGMAIYGDNKDFPKGVDVIYNTNKHRGTPAIDTNAQYVYNEKTDEWMWTGKEVLKRMKIDNKTMEVDKDNPFGALIRAPKERDGIITPAGQRKYIGEDGKEHLSPINKLQDEGDWDSWSRNLSSQFLSKQPMKLIKQQLDLTVQSKRNELDEILNLNNPIVKQKMLEDFASQTDANAADLSAQGFKKQAFQVILPIPKMSDKEIYAPNYKDGEMVALVRYPHGGTFEIPILKVNNKNNPSAENIMKNAADAVGIHPDVAERLSGADFDGDTVMVIPMTTNRISIKSTDRLKGLIGFDPKDYKLPDDAPYMKNSTKQNEMGRVTNLITDMTVSGAKRDEIERAVKHSMVVIDAEKHHLDYKQSAKDNRISALKKEYQGKINEETGKTNTGASTILSRSKAQVYVDKRKELTDTKKMTPEQLKDWNEGKVVYISAEKKKKVRITDPNKMTPDELKIHESGKKVYRTSNKNVQEKVYQMDTVDDARLLVHNPDNPKEMAYANFANALKSMANEARREARSIKTIPVSTEARKTYAEEVESLNHKLLNAKKNAPKERVAQSMANAITEEKFASNPDMDYEHRQRERARAINQTRAMVGAKKEQIVITDREWEAIQANAISSTKLREIMNNTDQDALKKRATPRKDSSALSEGQMNRLRSMLNAGTYTNAEIADLLGVSVSYVSKIANE